MASFTRSATLTWSGDVPRGVGEVSANSGSFIVPATFPRLSKEPEGTTTPEELLAASHAVCFGIGLRSVLAQRGATADRLHVTATISADKGGGQIRVTGAHLDATVEGLSGVDDATLTGIAHAAEQACTISALLRATIPISVSVRQTT